LRALDYISFGDGTYKANMDGEWFSIVDTGAVGADVVLNHSLKRVPVGYIVFAQDKAGSIYISGTPWTTSQAFLKGSTANMNIRVFLI
jgi:hypothetical protein